MAIILPKREDVDKYKEFTKIKIPSHIWAGDLVLRLD